MQLPEPDQFIKGFDKTLRTLAGVDQSSRPSPADKLSDTDGSQLSETEKQTAGRLMRINHCGEICAQALYLGQGLTSNDPATRDAMEHAAAEEQDHLTWCRKRLKELDTPTSRLDPLFFGLSFAGGAVSGLLGNRINLGFVAATEEQVVGHLESHLEKLPANDAKSRVILEQMKADEDSHRSTALKRGGADFPQPTKKLMTLMSRVMTRSTYWV